MPTISLFDFAIAPVLYNISVGSSMVSVFFVLVVTHLIADFLLQGELLATKKRGFNKYMLTHVGMVSAIFFVSLYFLSGSMHFYETVFVFICHLLVDITKKEIDVRYVKFDSDVFWSMVGIDQMLHVTTLYLVVNYIL